MSLSGGVLLATGYTIAGFSAQVQDESENSMSNGVFWKVLVAFVAIGIGATSVYLSALTTCAKVFTGRYRGSAMAVPIAGFGLGGTMTSLIATWGFFDSKSDSINVPKVFLFLALTSFMVGMIGGIRLNDNVHVEDSKQTLISQQSLLAHQDIGYNTMFEPNGEHTRARARRTVQRSLASHRNAANNKETVEFYSDFTMWLLTGAFFLTSGPGECFINNLGTLLPALDNSANGSPTVIVDTATHVSLFGITSTFARLLSGFLSDYLHSHDVNTFVFEQQHQRRFGRTAVLILFTTICALGFTVLATGVLQGSPQAFWIITCLIGLGYGSLFSLAPTIVSIVWGEEKFGTHWGLIEITPAIGGTIWGYIYSLIFTNATDSGDSDNRQCRGWNCYRWSILGMGISVLLAAVFWTLAWRAWYKRGLPV